MRLRLVLAVFSASLAVAAAIVACSDDDSSGTTLGGADGSTDGRTNPGKDGSSEEEDDASSGTDGGSKDAAKDAKNVRDANGPGEAGADCVFNHDCALALRCGACDAGFCVCEQGARGTGQNGIDKCDAGEQCTSALCVEGPGSSGDSYCSDECATNDDCTGMLPKCVSVPLFGDFCARDGG